MPDNNHHADDFFITGYSLPYDLANTNRSRDLRKNLTKAERIIWYKILQGRKFYGLKFVRQKTVGYYIVDFYCAQLKLAIEIDGELHYTADAIRYDNDRTSFLKTYGVKVVRFTNDEVLGNLDGVYAALEDKAIQSGAKIERFC